MTGVLMGPHRFEAAPGSTRCASCGSPRLALIHAVGDVPDPASGSGYPKAAAAAEIFPGRGIMPGLVSVLEEAGVMEPPEVAQAAERAALEGRRPQNPEDIAGCVECGEPLDQRPSAHCSKCLPPPPPFHPEPALGSPEAVEQAAQVLRFEIEPGFVLEASGTVAAFASGRAGLYQQAPYLLAEVERLRREVRLYAKSAEDATEQRDALADALEVARRELTIHSQNFVPALQPSIASANLAAIAAADEALRKAGRQ